MRPLARSLAALPAAVFFACGLAEAAPLMVETVTIDRTGENSDIGIAYPRTGNAAIDSLFHDWATAMADDFEKSADEDFASFTDDNGERPPWRYAIDAVFEVARNDDEMFIVNYDDSTFTGGAHPNHDIETFNLLMPDGWRVYLPEIFNGRPALDRISALAVADLMRQLTGPDAMSDPDWIRSGAGPSWDNFEDFLLLSDRLVIRFPPYQVAAYAAGSFKVEIPLSELSGLMRKDWRTPVPSFDCAKAGTATEHAICASVDLARLDRNLAGAFSRALQYADGDAAKTELRDAQRAWVRTRDACGGEAACIAEAYSARLKALQAG